MPCAIGDHASVSMPFCRLNARRSSCARYGCTSIWFTAGTVEVSSNSLRRWRRWKFDTPITLTRPDLWISSMAFHVST